MRGEALDDGERGALERERDDAPVGAARGEHRRRELQLADERGVALEEREARAAEERSRDQYTSYLGQDESNATHPVDASQTRTVVSSPPLAMRTPSKATV